MSAVAVASVATISVPSTLDSVTAATLTSSATATSGSGSSVAPMLDARASSDHSSSFSFAGGSLGSTPAGLSRTDVAPIRWMVAPPLSMLGRASQLQNSSPVASVAFGTRQASSGAFESSLGVTLILCFRSSSTSLMASRSAFGQTPLRSLENILCLITAPWFAPVLSATCTSNAPIRSSGTLSLPVITCSSSLSFATSRTASRNCAAPRSLSRIARRSFITAAGYASGLCRVVSWLACRVFGRDSMLTTTSLTVWISAYSGQCSGSSCCFCFVLPGSFGSTSSV
mmetsp:Transcript_107538/g.312759  ORF Transcript_107538/g.312759 Transcript_107538/m.312759 type:complete len:285 (-) Transcript_107538:1663-2517(-)